MNKSSEIALNMLCKSVYNTHVRRYLVRRENLIITFNVSKLGLAVTTMKFKCLQQILEKIETFENTKIELKQYNTSSHIAACILHTVKFMYGNITNKCVADLGCGSGILTIGDAFLGARYCINIDPSAISLSVENAADRDVSGQCEFILCDVKQIDKSMLLKAFDTVTMNLSFGTREIGADLVFLTMAVSLATTTVYSLHKTSTRKHVVSTAKQLGVHLKVIAVCRVKI